MQLSPILNMAMTVLHKKFSLVWIWIMVVSIIKLWFDLTVWCIKSATGNISQSSIGSMQNKLKSARWWVSWPLSRLPRWLKLVKLNMPSSLNANSRSQISYSSIDHSHYQCKLKFCLYDENFVDSHYIPQKFVLHTWYKTLETYTNLTSVWSITCFSFWLAIEM